MKNTKQIFILLLITLTLACGRYDEGPAFSLRSVEKRVANYYALDDFTKDGVDMRQEIADSCGEFWWFLSEKETYGKENSLMVYPTDSIVPYKANYVISPDNREIEIGFYPSTDFPYPYYYIGIEPFKGGVYLSWKIERLTKEEMWLSCSDSIANYYIKFKEQ